jgi:hypothetical protein
MSRATNKRKEQKMQLEQIVEPSELLVPSKVFSVTEAAELGRQIKASVQKVATDVLETAKLCLRAYERYGPQGLSVVLRAAEMEKTKFLKHMAIARDQRLGRIAMQLPAGYSVLYQITQLSDEVFEAAAKERIIHPDVGRGDIDALRKPSNRSNKQLDVREVSAALKEMVPGGRLELVVPNGIDAAACAEMRRVLFRLQTRFGAQFVSIKELDTTRTAVTTPTITSKSGGSPVNKPTVVQQPIAPPKGASLSAKSSS